MNTNNIFTVLELDGKNVERVVEARNRLENAKRELSLAEEFLQELHSFLDCTCRDDIDDGRTRLDIAYQLSSCGTKVYYLKTQR